MLENQEISLGLLSSQNFCNALAALPPSQLEALVVDCAHMEKGYASFSFFKNGEWRYVVVDTLVPYSHQRKQPLYTHNAGKHVFFVALLEKAYAKLNGGYDKIGGIPVEDIVVDFTNGLFTRVDFPAPGEASVG